MALRGKRAVVFGCANHRSLAWGVAEAWQRAGAALAIGVQSDRFLPALHKLTRHWDPPPHLFCCDVRADGDIDAAFAAVSTFHQGRVDALLHSIAFAPAAVMKNPLLQCSRDDFLKAQDISAYSFLALCRGAVPLMTAGGSLLTLSYVGSRRVVPQYSVMGAAKASLETTATYLAAELGPSQIRVNVISPGPIDTLAARGIPNFTDMLTVAKTTSPLGRGIQLGDVGDVATFLASDGARSITGQTLIVDCGQSILL